MKPPVWISGDIAIAVHERMVQVFGGSSGVRDVGLLDSALARPKNLFAYEDNPSIERLAAAYAYGIVQNHPFIDGNKRTAFTVANVFLGLNGRWLAASEAEAAVVMLDVVSGAVDEMAFAGWMGANTIPIDES